MSDLSEMWTICHDCPYQEVCEPPYSCAVTESKYRQTEQDKGGWSMSTEIQIAIGAVVASIIWVGIVLFIYHYGDDQ